MVTAWGLLPAAHAQAPKFLWAAKAGGTYLDWPRGIAVDPQGNSYITGIFRDPARFGNTTLRSQGDYDVFIAKCDSAGRFQWARSVGGSGRDFGFSVAADAEGNCYATGDFDGAATIGARSFNAGDSYLAKYDTAGALQWVQPVRGVRLAVDGSGNCYLAGGFSSTQATFGEITLTNSGARLLFIARYDPTGAIRWAVGAATGSASVWATAVDEGGTTALAGDLEGPTTFGQSTLTNRGPSDIFVARYDAAGALRWVRQVGGAGRDEAPDVALDRQGNTYLTGTVKGPATFGETVLTNQGSIAFVAKYDPAGSLAWVRAVGVGSGTSHPSIGGLAVDPGGASYLTGTLWGTVTFGVNKLTSIGSYDAFILKLDSAGDLLWVRQVGALGGDEGWDIAVDNAGRAHVVGAFGEVVNFDGIQLVEAGVTDVFVAKLDAFVYGPPLSIQRLGTLAVITWPTNAPGVSLQVTPSLTPPVPWQDASTTPAVVGDQNVVVEDAVSPSRFYRLKN
ncbi:MAG: SBBP repeat-containing protein [Verrucomicrobia bacterium]|nr:SBBP repeat-containing protein [Verrucomicrobiota bacterium]